ncbi:MAG: radical SAM protein, partial [Clostridiales bacterium]
MLDSYNRTIDYLRISITDRCNLRCVYCMPERGVANIEHQNVLTYEEILRICRIGAQLGISKLKITGGEPLLRRGAVEFISAAKQVPGIRQVTLTTNGLLLADYVNELLQAKVDGINISLDTLDGAAYREITRWGELNLVQNSIETAYTHGIRPIKINCVLIRGVNEQQAVPLAAMAAKRQISVRFIEMMPVGLGQQYQAVSGDEVLQLLAAAYGQPQPCGEKLGNGPAVYYTFPALCGKIGII